MDSRVHGLQNSNRTEPAAPLKIDTSFNTKQQIEHPDLDYPAVVSDDDSDIGQAKPLMATNDSFSSSSHPFQRSLHQDPTVSGIRRNHMSSPTESTFSSTFQGHLKPTSSKNSSVTTSLASKLKHSTSAHLDEPLATNVSSPILSSLQPSVALETDLLSPAQLGRRSPHRFAIPHSPKTWRGQISSKFGQDSRPLPATETRTRSWTNLSSPRSRSPWSESSPGSDKSPYVTASSYDSVSDSPAKRFLSQFAQSTIPTAAQDDEGQEIGSYIIGRQIGHGGFSIIKEAMRLEDGVEVKHAVKIVRKQAEENEVDNDAIQTHFDHEVNIWKCLSNQYILPLLSVIDTPYATWAFTPLCPVGTLYNAVRSHKEGLPLKMARKYAYQLGAALRYLHQDAHVVHRDVKLENCILDNPVEDGGNLLLCDFGLADFLPGEYASSPLQSYVIPNDSSASGNSAVDTEEMIAGGSLAFASPEQINSPTPLLLPAIDIWSYGVVVHAMIMGRLPFSHAFAPKLQMMIMKGVWDVDGLRNKVSADIAEVVIRCLEMECTKRWTVVDVLTGRWLLPQAELERRDETL